MGCQRDGLEAAGGVSGPSMQRPTLFAAHFTCFPLDPYLHPPSDDRRDDGAPDIGPAGAASPGEEGALRAASGDRTAAYAGRPPSIFRGLDRQALWVWNALKGAAESG